jgi:hypothetical protein
MDSRRIENMTKNRKLLIISVLLCFVMILACIFFLQNNSSNKLLYSQEYVVGQGNIKGNVNIESFLERSEYFDIGANSYGYAVFKEPNTAFAVFVELYSDGIELVQKEFNLEPLTETNYDGYKQCAFLMAGDSEAEKQARFIPEFLDIYENSFTLS